MKKLLVGVSVMAILVGVVVPILAQPDNASACMEHGYSPGYYRHHLDAWGSIDPYAWFDVAMRRSSGDPLVGPHAYLIDVLWTRGGQWDAFDRQAVAALINSDLYTPAWYSEWTVKSAVLHAYNTGDWSTSKTLFEAANSLD